MNPSFRVFACVSVLSLFGCASTVDGRAPDADAGVRDDAPTGEGTCAHWALRDREERNGGELFTDLHLTFDAQGRVVTQRQNVRTGGHGKNRTAQSFTYAWTAAELTITDDADDAERTVFSLDGDRLTGRVRESAQSVFRTSMRWERDASGRVVARVETREGVAPTRCTYGYDGAGHLVEVACSDGALERFQWMGDRPVRRDRSFQGRYPGYDTWEWNARGALVRERHDDGYGPGRLYRYDHTYDAAGRVVRTESVNDTSGERRNVAVFAWDDRGRLLREERSFDAAGVARSVVRWERDGEGRISARIASDGAPLRYSYEVGAQRIVVTESAGDWREVRTYQCLATAPRATPADPTPGVPVEQVNATAESFPANAWEP